jgi:hypothetical protein
MAIFGVFCGYFPVPMSSYTHPGLISPTPLPEVDLSTTGDGVSLAAIFAEGDCIIKRNGKVIRGSGSGTGTGTGSGKGDDNV